MSRDSRNNRLKGEKSPYLLQHANNPVDWYPWGDEAFGKARAENKPIFLSIGYSTCHWCHVMAHESFESEQTAAIMNREFVNIKVDREERPDVDRVYMTFVQSTTGHGGWPMSVWLTPELKPFVGGTYFPPEDRYGQPAFTKLLERIASAWKENREKLVSSGERIVEALRDAQSARGESSGNIEADVLDSAYHQFEQFFDPVEGGFGNSPKFPHPVTLNFLTRYWARCETGFQPTNDRQDADATNDDALKLIVLTLRKMAAGGMHDHLGGGFHRYSVDRFWHVPHFEKMLYDQAQLTTAYLEGFQITHDDRFAAVARDILQYVLRDMTAPNGGFYSAEDADSPVSEHKMAEGAFYVWTKQEIDSALGDAAEMFNFAYGVQAHGNVREGSDPHDEFRGKNILFQEHSVADTASHFGISESEAEKSLGRSRQKLFDIRTQRPRPHLDDKILAAWNGLMISAFARAAQVLGESKYADAAIRAARFLQQNLYDSKTGLLYRSFREGRSTIEGFADDYAFLIQGLLDLYEATFEVQWLRFALELQKMLDRLFYDKSGGGYFSTSGKDTTVFLRLKDDNDSAEPAASSIASLNLLRLAQITNDRQYTERANETIAAFGGTLSRFPSAMPQMLVALDFSLSKPLQVVIAGKADAPDTTALLAELHRHFRPNKVLLLADDGENQRYLAEKNEAIRSMSPVSGLAAAYVCENFTCQAPVTEPKQLAEILTKTAGV